VFAFEKYEIKVWNLLENALEDFQICGLFNCMKFGKQQVLYAASTPLVHLTKRN
jgi:hypothetical protein